MVREAAREFGKRLHEETSAKEKNKN